MNKMRILSTMNVMVLCLATLQVACGGDGEDEATGTAKSTPSGHVDACSLLTDAEVAEALGGSSNPPQPSMLKENISQCMWRIQGGSQLDSAVVVQARGDTSDDDFERLVKENAPEVAGELLPIDGLGDKAYQHIATFVLSDDSMVVVTVIGNDTIEQTEQKQQDLARAAIQRLP